jgi:hypothetical protein
MKRFTAFMLFVSVMTSCSSGPRHLEGQAFQRAYESRNAQTLEDYRYLGITNGAVYMIQTRAPLFGSELKLKVMFTETNTLDPKFLREMCMELKPVTNTEGNIRPDGP